MPAFASIVRSQVAVKLETWAGSRLERPKNAKVKIEWFRTGGSISGSGSVLTAKVHASCGRILTLSDSVAHSTSVERQAIRSRRLCYSCRSANNGSMREARRAGT
jgi:hypothetical protein